MRSPFRTTPAVFLAGLLLAGCSGSSRDNFKPPDRPAKPVVATVTAEIPAMV